MSETKKVQQLILTPTGFLKYKRSNSKQGDVRGTSSYPPSPDLQSDTQDEITVLQTFGYGHSCLDLT